MFFTDAWFLLAVVPGILAAYFLLHAVSAAASAWLLLAASAAVVARYVDGDDHGAEPLGDDVAVDDARRDGRVHLATGGSGTARN